LNVQLHLVGMEGLYCIEMLKIERVIKKAGFKTSFVISATQYLKVNEYIQKHAYYIKEFVAKEKISQALFNMNTGHSKVAKSILDDCKTKDFKLKREICRLLCLLPMPIYRKIIELKNFFNSYILI